MLQKGQLKARNVWFMCFDGIVTIYAHSCEDHPGGERESPGPTRKVSILSLWLALQTLSLILRWAPHYLLLSFFHLMTQFQMLGFQSWFWDNFSIDGKNKPILTMCLPLLCVIFVKLSHLFFSCLNSLLPQQLWGYIY